MKDFLHSKKELKMFSGTGYEIKIIGMYSLNNYADNQKYPDTWFWFKILLTLVNLSGWTS
jgi:hypothetical protein